MNGKIVSVDEAIRLLTEYKKTVEKMYYFRHLIWIQDLLM